MGGSATVNGCNVRKGDLFEADCVQITNQIKLGLALIHST